jgi:CheY-like chemotaxis protein
VQVDVRRVNSHAEITVSDTGIGIAPAFLPFVFERFRQADAGTTRKTGGLGLGLSIARHLVEMHGGEIQAESAGEGEGATFRITMPLMIVSQKADGPGRQHPRAERRDALTDLASLDGVHILAVDDEPDALSLLRATLEAAGARVTTLTAARAVLATAREVQPDALLLDLGMPEMDGYEVIRQLRTSSDTRLNDLPAAALTAFARSEDRIKALRCGFQLHLAKPVDPGELVAAVATLVGRPRG